MAIKSAIVIQGNNICQSPLVMVTNIYHHTKGRQYQKMSSITIWLNNKKFKIIYNNFPYTPSKVGVLVRKTFSLTLDEAMSVGLAKACALRKKLFCYREN